MQKTYWFFDSRSLAVSRILLGLVAVWTFAEMAADAPAFFGPDGVLPADVAWNGYSSKPWLRSFLFAFPESAAAPMWVLALGALGAVLLAVGLTPKAGALLAWWALASLSARNPLILHAGDALLSIMLLFSLVLPGNRHFTVLRKARGEPLLISNFASTLWLLQVSIIYLAAGLAKLPNPSWLDATHMERILAGTEYVSELGRWLGNYVLPMRVSTISSLIFELALAVLIVVLPSRFQRVRLWLVVITLVFHLMIALTLQVGLFPVLSLTALSTLLPPLFWDRLTPGKITGLVFSLPPIRPTRHRGWQAVAAGSVAIALGWEALGNAIPGFRQFPRSALIPFYQLNWLNNWSVFALTPTRRDRLGIEAVLKSGPRIDVMLGTDLIPTQFESLPSETDRYGGSRWRFFLFSNLIQRPEMRFLAPRYLRLMASRYGAQRSLDGAVWELVVYSAPIPKEEPLQLTRLVLCTYPEIAKVDDAKPLTIEK